MVDPLTEFLEAALVPRDAAHVSGTLDEAEAIRVAHPDIGGRSIHAAAALGIEPAVRRFLAADPALATRKGGPREWDPLTCLCFSRYLRLDPARSDGFVAAATALLDAGASATTGWFEAGHQPSPEWESVLYGAAGIAHHPGLTRLLLERGADPNDGETAYHAPEGYDNRALAVLVESGKLTPESLALMLVRKHDWHDADGVAYLLAQGADPNRRWGVVLPLHHAITRDNGLEIVEQLLDHGADPGLAHQGLTVAARAARHGRGDVLRALERRGHSFNLSGVDRLIAACARADADGVRALAADRPLVDLLLSEGGTLLARFAGVGNINGLRLLLELGVPVTAAFPEGDGYWDLAPRSQALHAAAWRARHEAVEFLLERGAPMDAEDGKGRTPLVLAVKACVDSYWSGMRSPRSVAALLGAGASTRGITRRSGYAEIDRLLVEAGVP